MISSGDEEALVQAVGTIEDDLADEMFRALPLGPFSRYRRNKNRVCAKLAMSTVVQRLRAAAPGRPARSRTSRPSGSATAICTTKFLTLLLAGHHTTGSTAAWLPDHMAAEPALMDEVAGRSG